VPVGSLTGAIADQKGPILLSSGASQLYRIGGNQRRPATVDLEGDGGGKRLTRLLTDFHDVSVRVLVDEDGRRNQQYQGNVFVSEWNGCPDAALRKLVL